MEESNIKYQALLPLQWQQAPTPPDSDMLFHVRENNLDSLKQALLLDEFSPIGQEDHMLQAHDSARLEKKVDLLLSLVGSMIQQQRSTARYAVILTNDSLQWQAADLSGLHAGQLLTLQLYLHPFSVAALTLYGEISEAASNMCKVNLRFLDSSVQELLQKYIFLNHRRQIAAARQSASTKP